MLRAALGRKGGEIVTLCQNCYCPWQIGSLPTSCPAGSSALDPAERLVRKRDHSELFSKHILSLKMLSIKSKLFSCGSVNTIWQPISFPNIAEHGCILTKCGAQSVSRLLLNMGKSLRNAEAYQFPKYC